MLFYLADRMLAGPASSGDWHALTEITPRASLAAGLSFVLALVLGPRMIAWLRSHCREPIKSPSPEVARLHQAKASMPTMGGMFIVAGLGGGAAIFADWSNPYVPLAMLLVTAMAALGACDDWIKLTTPAQGLGARTKLLAQIAIATTAAMLLHRIQQGAGYDAAIYLPWLGRDVALGWGFVPWATLVIVGSSNAVNLSDGLDGLAGGCLVCATAAVGVVVYTSGHAGWSAYLGIPYVAGADETAVLAAAMVGGLLGFLWFNCHPASVFMGDVGSLPLGGLLGLLALAARQELLLVAIGGVFVAEAVSVIVQVLSCRYRKRRVFLCAPLHHHFQLKGWSEDKIVVRFWIAAMLCAIVGLAGLKSTSGVQPPDARLTQVQETGRLRPN